jgi:hypothetical protein
MDSIKAMGAESAGRVARADRKVPRITARLQKDTLTLPYTSRPIGE